MRRFLWSAAVAKEPPSLPELSGLHRLQLLQFALYYPVDDTKLHLQALCTSLAGNAPADAQSMPCSDGSMQVREALLQAPDQPGRGHHRDSSAGPGACDQQPQDAQGPVAAVPAPHPGQPGLSQQAEAAVVEGLGQAAAAAG